MLTFIISQQNSEAPEENVTITSQHKEKKKHQPLKLHVVNVNM
jgi:hypothetical protein